ncbi:MAG: DUF362 domain-containing protein [Sedimentisphaerales bacterium]|nr:DUF362 domain-containing protein [Sedimentisphaerales bacterium]
MADFSPRIDRRGLLKALGLGGLGLAAGRILTPSRAFASPGSPLVAKGKLYQTTPERARVALVKGNDRRDNVLAALKQIEDQVVPAIGNKKVLVKPNFVSTNRPLAATHVDTVRAILDFLKPHVKSQIIVAESPAGGSAMTGFQNYDYLKLEQEYNCTLVDLNGDDQTFQYRYVLGRGNAPTPIRIISTFLDPDLYIISAAKMKTHDRVVTTLSLKNILMASPLVNGSGRDKGKMHQAERGQEAARDTNLHFNLFSLAQEIYPDLGVIDGFEAMEGAGPVNGTPVDARVALASTDCLALDCLTTKLMGFDASQILYLASMGQAGMGQTDLAKIDVLGTPAEQCQFHFKVSDRVAQAYGITA